ncbi:hypothetical protein, partial [Pontibacter rugosus]
MKLIFSFILTVLIFCKNDITEIKLNYNRTTDNQVWSNGIDVLTIKASGKEIQKVLTDETGTAAINKAMINKHGAVDVFLTSIGVEELYLTTIDNAAIDLYEVNIPRHYRFKFDRAVCP